MERNGYMPIRRMMHRADTNRCLLPFTRPAALASLNSRGYAQNKVGRGIHGIKKCENSRSSVWRSPLMRMTSIDNITSCPIYYFFFSCMITISNYCIQVTINTTNILQCRYQMNQKTTMNQ